MEFVRQPVVTALLVATALVPSVCAGAVSVISNRTEEEIPFTVEGPDGKRTDYRLAPWDVTPVPVVATAELTFDSGEGPLRYRLEPYFAFAFQVRLGKLELSQFRIPAAESKGKGDTEEPADNEAVELPPVPETDPRRHAILKLPVVLLVDDDEPAVRAVWEKRLRDRLADASDVLERTCRVRLEAVEVATWDSDDAVRDFAESMAEFEREVLPAAGRIAIGFTSQYEVTRGRENLGGTRGPLHSHVLIREYSPNIEEPQRLEVLVHELGHFLGAVHVQDPTSVMRPMLTDRRSNARSFAIRFDAVNTLILYQVAEEMRTRRVRRFGDLSSPVKTRLRAIFAAVDKANPRDKTAAKYIARLDAPPEFQLNTVRVSGRSIDGARTVVQAIVAAADRRHAATLSGDRLSERYVRVAAAAAAELPEEIAPRAFLLGLGIGLDDSGTFRSSPVLGALCRRIESDEERATRLRVLGRPTLTGRRDLAQHFFLSCSLAEVAGPARAEAAGLFKELLDARRGSGFSFADLAADLAGAEFARRVGDGNLKLNQIAISFRASDHMPPVSGLKEGLAWKALLRTYGMTNDGRFQREVSAIRERIAALPAYTDRR